MSPAEVVQMDDDALVSYLARHDVLLRRALGAGDTSREIDDLRTTVAAARITLRRRRADRITDALRVAA